MNFFFPPTDWLWVWDKMSWKSKLLKDLTHVASEIKILLHHFKEYQESFTPDCAFPPVCVYVHMHRNRPDSDQMFPCKPPWTAHIFSQCLCMLHTSPSPSHKLNSCTRGWEPGHMSPTITHVHGVSQRLTETHCELRLQQRGREVCLNSVFLS